MTAHITKYGMAAQGQGTCSALSRDSSTSASEHSHLFSLVGPVLRFGVVDHEMHDTSLGCASRELASSRYFKRMGYFLTYLASGHRALIVLKTQRGRASARSLGANMMANGGTPRFYLRGWYEPWPEASFFPFVLARNKTPTLRSTASRIPRALLAKQLPILMDDGLLYAHISNVDERLE
jgi:hypothetical protein